MAKRMACCSIQTSIHSNWSRFTLFLLQLVLVFYYRDRTLLFTLTKNKTTDTIQSIETKFDNELQILKDPNVGKERKTEAKRKLNLYQKHLKNVSDKEINGKEYPKQLYHSGPEPMDKKEIYKLIDTVGDIRDMEEERMKFRPDMYDNTAIDLSGVSVGKDRFVEIDQTIDIRTSILDLSNK